MLVAITDESNRTVYIPYSHISSITKTADGAQVSFGTYTIHTQEEAEAIAGRVNEIAQDVARGAWLVGIPDKPIELVNSLGEPTTTAMDEAGAAQHTGDNGYMKAPPRYTRQGRETIDRIRDYFHLLVEQRWHEIDPTNIEDVTRFVFTAFCDGQQMRYEDRAGAKGDPKGDQEKAAWYRAMGNHAWRGHPDKDPRHERPDFQPYQRQPWRDGGAE